MRPTLLNSGPIVIACAADDNFAMPMAVMAYSLLNNLDENIAVHFYLLDGGITDANKLAIESIILSNGTSVEITWLSPPREFSNAKWNTTQDLTDATLLCLFLPDLLPSSIEKVIYLDCDLIVNTSIHELWQKDVDNYPLLAVQDFGVVNVSSQYGIPVYKELGLSPSTPYFNAGVLVINCKAWKKAKVGKKAVEYLKRYSDVQRFNDQEAMNAVLRGNFGVLPLQWNQQTILFRSKHEDAPFSKLSESELQSLKKDPWIIHYTEHPNPWSGRCTHPHRHVFLEYLHKSGWFSRRSWLRFKSKYRALSIWQYVNDTYRKACNVTRPFRHALQSSVVDRYRQMLARQ